MITSVAMMSVVATLISCIPQTLIFWIKNCTSLCVTYIRGFMTIKIENWRCCPSRPCRASWRTGLESSRSSSSPCSSSSSPWWSSPWSSSRDGEGQKQNVLNRKAWTYSSMFTQFRWLYHHLNHPILPRRQNFIPLLQDKDKNEYLLKASETYEPLNVNFVDLYQVRNWFTKSLPFHS